jgi:hypothetical protein
MSAYINIWNVLNQRSNEQTMFMYWKLTPPEVIYIFAWFCWGLNKVDWRFFEGVPTEYVRFWQAKPIEIR